MPFSRGVISLERRLYLGLRAFADRRVARKALRAGLSARPQHLLTGECGEDHAFFYLRERRYTVVARRWVSDRVRGDLDLVAWDGDTLVVFEIKTRTARDLFPARAEVDGAKQRQLRRMTAAYLAQLPARHRTRVPVRFDVLSVYLLSGAVEVEHTREAFPYREPADKARL